MKLSSNNETGETGGRMPAVSVIDPAPRPTRRTFTGAYKLATVAEYEAAPHGQKNAVLRREGLYHSHIVEWAAARNAGSLSRAGKPAQAAAPEGPKSAERSGNERLRKENQRLTRQLTQAKAALDLMGKAHVLLESLAESTDTSTSRRS